MSECKSFRFLIVPKAAGRRHVSTSVEYKSVYGVLGNKSALTCRPCMHSGSYYHALNRTLHSLHLFSRDLHDVVSYRKLCMYFNDKRNGFVRGKPILDFCSTCYSWDHAVAPQLTQVYNEYIGRIEAIIPTYFDQLKKSYGESFPWLDSLSWTRQFYRYILVHREHLIVVKPAVRKTK